MGNQVQKRELFSTALYTNALLADKIYLEKTLNVKNVYIEKMQRGRKMGHYINKRTTIDAETGEIFFREQN